MSFIAKNPLTIPEVESSPSVPKSGTRGLFAGKDGWYDVDSSQNVSKIATLQEVDSKIEDIKVDTSIINNKDTHYGNTNAILSDAKMFSFVANIDGITASVSTASENISGNVVIPYACIIDGKTYVVNTISNGCFSACRNITSIAIPDTVTEIGWCAFENCEKLESVVIYGDVPSIEGNVFAGCSSLKYVTLPETITLINGESFMGCTSLRDIYFNGTEEQWKRIEILEPIIFNARIHCDNRLEFTVENNVVSYASTEREKRYGDSSIIPTDASCFVLYDNYISWYRGNGANVIIPYKIGGVEITAIGMGAFEYNSYMVNLVVPNGITDIYDSAFNSCSNLTSITLPVSITNIGYNAFMGCDCLKDVYFVGTEEQWNDISIIDGNETLLNATIHFNYDPALATKGYVDGIAIQAKETAEENSLNMLYYGNINITPTDASLFEYVMEGNTWCITGYKGTYTDVVIPYEINGIAVTSIGSWAFWSNTVLNSVTIPNSVTTIANDAFRGCSNLKSVTIPDSVITIANDAFMDCDSLTSITIPDSVTTIGINAFSGCDALIVICDQGSHAEEYCKANNIKYVLDTVSPDSLGGGGSVNLDNYYTKNQVDDKLEDKADADLLYYYGEIVTPTDASLFNFDSTTGTITEYKGSKAEVVIPYEINGVKVIKLKDNAFAGNSIITSVIIPNSITTMGYSVFSKCTKLKKVVLPKSITAITGNLFSECSALESINIPSSVTAIWDYAFYKCTKLTSLELPESLVGIDPGAFQNTGLKKIKIPMTEGRIGSGALSGTPTDLIVYCSQGSPVENYCKTNNIKYVLLNIDGSVYANLLATIEALQAKSVVKMVSIDLPASAWVEDGVNQFHQVVEIDGITSYSKVDLQPTTEQLVIFHQKDITFVTENIDGVITVYCIGQMPLLDYTIQATITEVV